MGGFLCTTCKYGKDRPRSRCSYCANHAFSEWDSKISIDALALYPNKAILDYMTNDLKVNTEMAILGGRSNGKTLRTLEEAAKKIGCRVVAESWFRSVNMPGIEKVIFNDPATIVFWDDGTKTVVKAQNGELFDPEKGLAMAISKKALGNKGNYFDEFKKWLPKETAPKSKPCKDFDCFMRLSEAAKNAANASKSLKSAREAIAEIQRMEQEQNKKDKLDNEWQRALTEYLEGLKK